MPILFSEKEKMFDRGEARAKHRRSPDEKLEWYRIIGESIRSGFAEFIIATRFAFPRLDNVYAGWDQFVAGVANDRKTAGGLFEIYCYGMAKRNFIKTDWLNTEFMPKYRKSVGENLGLNDLYETQFELFNDLSRTCNAAGSPERIIDSLNKFNARFQRTEQGFVPTPTPTVERLIEMLEDSITQNTIVVDPCCGRGIFLLMLRRRYPEHRIYGIEKDVGKAYLAAAFLEPRSNSRIVSNVFVRDTLTIKNFDKEIFNMDTMALSDAANGIDSSRIVFVGNPPYQKDSAGYSNRRDAIYHLFVEHALRHGTEAVFIIPARWYFGGNAKGLNAFRDHMLTSNKVKQIVDFPNAKKLFPTVELPGGVCFLNVSNSHRASTLFIDGDGNRRQLNLSRYDILVRNQEVEAIIDKVKSRHSIFLSQYVGGKQSFGVSSNYFDGRRDPTGDDLIGCRIRDGVVRYIKRKDIRRKRELIDQWKVIVSSADGAANNADSTGRKRVMSISEVIPPRTICSETYLAIAGCFRSETEASNCSAYLLLKFPRFMLGIRKMKQDISPNKFLWVPYMDFTRSWTDQQLYDHFDLTADERAYIEATIR